MKTATALPLPAALQDPSPRLQAAPGEPGRFDALLRADRTDRAPSNERPPSRASERPRSEEDATDRQDLPERRRDDVADAAILALAAAAAWQPATPLSSTASTPAQAIVGGGAEGTPKTAAVLPPSSAVAIALAPLLQGSGELAAEANLQSPPPSDALGTVPGQPAEDAATAARAVWIAAGAQALMSSSGPSSKLLASQPLMPSISQAQPAQSVASSGTDADGPASTIALAGPAVGPAPPHAAPARAPLAQAAPGLAIVASPDGPSGANGAQAAPPLAIASSDPAWRWRTPDNDAGSSAGWLPATEGARTDLASPPGAWIGGGLPAPSPSAGVTASTLPSPTAAGDAVRWAAANASAALPGGRLQVDLQSAQWGPMGLDLRLDGQGQAHLVVHAASEAARQSLGDRSDQLVQSLQSLGLALQVDVRQGSSQRFSDPHGAAAGFATAPAQLPDQASGQAVRAAVVARPVAAGDGGRFHYYA